MLPESYRDWYAELWSTSRDTDSLFWVSRTTSLLREKHYPIIFHVHKKSQSSYGFVQKVKLDSSLRIFMFHLIYKSSSCYIPWPSPTEELLITSSDSYWLPYCNTLNMQYFCQFTFLSFTCNLSWGFWIISTSILKYKLKTMLTGNILSEAKWHMPEPWPISIW